MNQTTDFGIFAEYPTATRSLKGPCDGCRIHATNIHFLPGSGRMREVCMGDLRHCDRYLPKRGAYIVFSPSFTRRGPLINISREGLSCIYYVNDTMDARSMDTCVNIRYGNFFLGSLPFRIISDKRIGTGRFGPFKMVRQRSLIFEALSVSQVVQVDYFIQNFTRLKYDFLEGPSAYR